MPRACSGATVPRQLQGRWAPGAGMGEEAPPSAVTLSTDHELEGLSRETGRAGELAAEEGGLGACGGSGPDCRV